MTHRHHVREDAMLKREDVTRQREGALFQRLSTLEENSSTLFRKIWNRDMIFVSCLAWVVLSYCFPSLSKVTATGVHDLQTR